MQRSAQTLVFLALVILLPPALAKKHAPPPVPETIMQAKSVYIVCDACLRGMAAAKMSAFQTLEDWGHFKVVRNPKQADLIFLFSPNDYLGDYLTRDGPDTRPVRVVITYMDVLDPHTGESLWSDSREWGSWLVARATKSLILELRDRMEEQGQ